MEYGFYHPERGYWQAIGGDPEALLQIYPEGTVQVPLKPDTDYRWQDGSWVYVAPEADPIRLSVLKSTVQQRIIDAGKMDDAYGALTANPVYFARWFAPDHPVVYCDDPDAVGLVTALGLDPAVVLAA